MSDYKSHGGKPIEFCGDQEGWIAVGSLSSDSPDSPCFPHVVLLGMGLGESGKEHPSNIAAMLTIDQATDLCGRLTAAMIVDRPAPTTATAPGLDLDAIDRAERAMTPGPWPIVDPNDREPGPPVWCGSNFGGVAAIGPIHYDTDEDELIPGSPAYLRAEADSRGIVALRNAAPALIAEVRDLRAKLAEVRELIDSTEHESSCTIGPYGPGQNGADCNCLVGTIAAALEAL